MREKSKKIFIFVFSKVPQCIIIIAEVMLMNVKSKLVHVSAFVLFSGICAVFIASSFGLDLDVLWHIKMGKDIFETGRVSTENYYSWIENTYWNQQEWLYDLFLYVVIKYADIWGFCLIHALAQALLFLLGYKLSKPENVILYSLLFCVLFDIFPSAYMNRPSEYSTFAFILFMYLFSKSNYKYLCVYFSIGIFMANFHCGTAFVLIAFLVLQLSIYIIASIFTKEKIENLKYHFSGLLLFALGCFINPCGPRQLYNMFTAVGLETLKYIEEWKPLATNNYVPIIGLMIVIMSFSYNLKNWKRDDIYNIALMSAFFTLMISSVRGSTVFMYLYFCYGYKYTEKFLCDFADLFSKPSDWMFFDIKFGKREFISIIISGVLTSCLIFSIKGNFDFNKFIDVKSREYISSEIIDYLKANNGKKLLNSYSDGNVLLWNDVKVFVDTRQHPYSKEFEYASSMDDMIDMVWCKDKDVMNEYFDEYDFDEVLCDKDFLDISWYMNTRDDFECLYKTDKSELWVKK